MILFGGRNEDSRYSDTWEWDGVAWTRQEWPVNAPIPGARSGHCMSYDAARRRVVMLGGDTTGAYLGDLWELPSNSPPVLSAVSLSATPGTTTAFVTQHVTLSATASDEDHDFLDFAWTQLSGPTVALSGTDSSVASFQPTTAATYAFGVSVFDGREGWAYAMGNVTVKPNRPPDISRVTTTTDCCASVTLSPRATDRDGNLLTYAWLQTSGPTVSLAQQSDTPELQFTPEGRPYTGEVYSFQLTADDERGGITVTTHTVTVRPNGNPPVGRLSFQPGSAVTTTAPTSVVLTIDFDKPVKPVPTGTFTR
ncbi:MAG: hypothetical protein HY814_11310 [Candidatus Riflebacteria bacterium]|nr:hypothetical protein [Candidatus Riflebacteria bacterium]